MNAQVQWLTPSPLWAQLSQATDLTAYRRPAILRFATDTFMPELQAKLQQSPQDLVNYVATGETWTNPTAGLNSKSTLPLKLFQPVQSRFYLISSSLACRKPGLPDHTISKSQGESVVFVLRQLRPNTASSSTNCSVYDPTRCTEYAWISTPGVNGAAGSIGDQPEWVQIPCASVLAGPVTGEQTFPLSPTQAGSNGSARRIWTGLIPASRRQQYIAARTITTGSSASSASSNGNGSPLDPRADMFNRQIVVPWTLLAAWWTGLDPTAIAASSEYLTSAQQSSALILADFAAFLSAWIPDVWTAIQKGSTSGLTNAELTLYNFLGTNLQQAILNANSVDSQLEAAGSTPVTPTNYTFYSLADPSNGINLTTLQTNINAALPTVSASQLPDPQPVPQKPSDPLGTYWFIVRCIYLRPQCGYNVVSPPSQPFQLAGYFDSDAPARRIQVELPVDTSASALRKFDKGVAFLMSAELQNQMAQVPTLQDLANGNLSTGGGGIGIGWICSFSIPIITICAMILLFVLVIALNIVFFWLPFFKICFPVPQMKAKT